VIHVDLHHTKQSCHSSTQRFVEEAARELSQLKHCRVELHIVELLSVEPLGTMFGARDKPDIAKRSQVLSPQMIDPSGSMFSNATVLCGLGMGFVSGGVPPHFRMPS
jgi:hypothetical protein